jgi:hypothetical protein
VFLEMFLKGLSWGVFGVSVLIPLCAFSVAWSHLGPILKRAEEQKEEELELLTDLFEEDEDEPELPSNEGPPRYKYIASTIVRPPNIVQREDDEEDDENGD